MKQSVDNDNQIFFYEQNYYPFSNFSSFQVYWKGYRWMTAEHAYHSEKFINYPDIVELLKQTTSAHDAFKLAAFYKDKYVENWDDIKLNIMEQILTAKIEQHPYVKKKLFDSGDKELIENSWRDSYWGWGDNKDGENNLGKTWMKVRDKIFGTKYISRRCIGTVVDGIVVEEKWIEDCPIKINK